MTITTAITETDYQDEVQGLLESLADQRKLNSKQNIRIAELEQAILQHDNENLATIAALQLRIDELETEVG